MALIVGTIADDILRGTIEGDGIDGGRGRDTLTGDLGDDNLVGGYGADRLIGGYGNDTFFINGRGDRIVEWRGKGFADTAIASISLRLPFEVENLVLTGTGALSGLGNRADNWIVGNTGGNLLDGRRGADTLEGGLGDDIYVVDDGGDRIIEVAGNGTDLVRSNLADYTLGAALENLRLYGVGSIGRGNELANAIIGTQADNSLHGEAGNDILRGGGGADRLFEGAGDGTLLAGNGDDRLEGDTGDDLLRGGAGNDFLIGGAGRDKMLGGAGNDVYGVDDAGDIASEFGGGGHDRVDSSIDYRLPRGIEDLTLLGSATRGTGNDLDNVLFANIEDNILDGREGADTMYGRGGNDTFHVDDVNDRIADGDGSDTVVSTITYTLDRIDTLILSGTADIDGTIAHDFGGRIIGNVGANVLTGGRGLDRLNGGDGDDSLFDGVGFDTLIGGAGADGFYFDTGGTDAIRDFVSSDDTIFLDRSVYTAVNAGTLDADAFHVGTSAQDAEDRIIYDQAAGEILYDPDGAGGARESVFIRVTPGLELSNIDFVGYG